ncbi:MAG: hypothetical protein WDW38_008521 [Sanguina aurantia]
MQAAVQDAADQVMGDEAKENSNALDLGQSMRLKERHGRRNSITMNDTDAAPQMSKLWGMLGALEGEHQSMTSRRDSLAASRGSSSVSASFEAQPRVVPHTQTAAAVQPMPTQLPPRHAIPSFCPVPASTTTSRPGTAPAAPAPQPHQQQHAPLIATEPHPLHQAGATSTAREQALRSSNPQMQKLHDMFGSLEGKMQQMTSQAALQSRQDPNASRPATAPHPPPLQPHAVQPRPVTTAALPAATSHTASHHSAKHQDLQQQPLPQQNPPVVSAITQAADAKRPHGQFSVPTNDRVTLANNNNNSAPSFVSSARPTQPSGSSSQAPTHLQHPAPVAAPAPAAASAAAAPAVTHPRPHHASTLQAATAHHHSVTLHVPTHLPDTSFHGSASAASVTASLCDTAAEMDGAGARGEKEVAVQLPVGHMSSRAGQAAAELINDSVFLKLADEALNAQLQRTRDGATDKSRIQELAALVKLLRALCA